LSVTVIIPFHNEEENILQLARELAAIETEIGNLTAVFVDDGSSDGTWQAIQQVTGLHSWVRGVRHSASRGQSAALLSGLRQATGDFIVTMDGDLQNDPADIPNLLERLRQCDVVCGCRIRRDDTVSRRWGSLIANRVRQWVTHDGIRDTGCGLKAFRRECISDLPPLKGMHRFMPAYFMLHDRRIAEVPVNHRSRQHGASKYTNLGRLPSTLFDLFGFYWYRRRLLAAKTPAS
jgi:dolichol-phosphate mannosyltransferase